MSARAKWEVHRNAASGIHNRKNCVDRVECEMHVPFRLQQAMMFKASPAWLVSLYRDCISRPVRYMVRIT